MATAVVCDYDPIFRAAMSNACTDVGLEVVAETDRGTDALELVRRFDVDALVIDVNLGDGSGEATLRALQEDPEPPEIVVFTRYATEPEYLIGLGARDVVAKPDIEGLERVLTGVVLSIEAAAGQGRQERRRLRRRIEAAPRLTEVRPGIASAEDLLRTAEHTAVGDAVLVVTVDAARDQRATAAPGRLLQSTVRVQDVVHELPALHGFVAVLRGGHDEAAEAVWRRMCGLAAEAGIADALRGAWSRVDELGVLAAVDRASDALVTGMSAAPEQLHRG